MIRENLDTLRTKKTPLGFIEALLTDVGEVPIERVFQGTIGHGPSVVILTASWKEHDLAALSGSNQIETC
ncbi:protein of unknown function [Candidatus Nitrospira inopinata]|uniref:Uncharacterized protein n=1 Tax=Candidatus Nitrospira inopinata TaxID=1715989 RepID=A0A0S4KTJ0_9BACT|nr:protein of unknown function [Candidatus Nitrospira inopinata]